MWAELEQLVDRAGNKPSQLGADGVRRLGARYRATAADLAIARRQFPGDPVVGSARTTGERARARPCTTRRAAAEPPRLRRAWLLAQRARADRLGRDRGRVPLRPALLGGYWAWRDPGAAGGLVPSEFQYVSEPRTRGQDWGVSVDDQAAFSSKIFTNNIRVAIVAFAGGILLGVGALYMLITNGLVLGATFGIAVGRRQRSTALPTGRSRTAFLELSCIAVGGRGRAAHRVGDHRPGYRDRAASRCAKKRAPRSRCCSERRAWLVVAGLVEGFVTPSGQALGTVLVIGVGLGALFWGSVVCWRGRTHRRGRAGATLRAALATSA